MIELVWFFAQQSAPQNSGNFLLQFAPFILIFVLFWFLIIRPSRKRDKEHQRMLNALKTGDQIVTSSGIYGEVTEVSIQTAVIEIAPKVKITVQRNVIAAITSPPEKGKSVPVPKPESEETISATRKKRKK